MALPTQAATMWFDRTLDRTVQKALDPAQVLPLPSRGAAGTEQPIRALLSAVKIKQLPWMTYKIPSNSKIL